MTGKEIYEVGDKVKIISQKVIGTIKEVNINRYWNIESMTENFSGYYLVNDGKNTYHAYLDDVEIYVPTSQLTKYKRAFEILKDSEIIKIGNNPFNNTYYLQRNDTNGNIVVIKLTKEEYELLEELMNNE